MGTNLYLDVSQVNSVVTLRSANLAVEWNAWSFIPEQSEDNST